MGAGGGGGIGADTVGDAVQTVGAALLPAGDRDQTDPRAWSCAADQPVAARDPGVGGPIGRAGVGAEQCQERRHALAGRRPARDRSGRGRSEPDREAVAAGAMRPRRLQVPRPAQATALIAALPLRRPGALRDRPLRRTPPRRAPGPAMGRHRPSTSDLIQVEHAWDRQAGSSRRRAAPANAASQSPRPCAANSINHRLQQGNGGQGFVFQTNGRTPSTPAPSNPHTQGLESAGLNRSASTNADTATPPT